MNRIEEAEKLIKQASDLIEKEYEEAGTVTKEERLDRLHIQNILGLFSELTYHIHSTIKYRKSIKAD